MELWAIHSLLPSLILGKYPYLSSLVDGTDKSDHAIGPAKVNEPYLIKLDGYEILFDSKGYIIVNINIMDGRCPLTLLSPAISTIGTHS